MNVPADMVYNSRLRIVRAALKHGPRSKQAIHLPPYTYGHLGRSHLRHVCRQVLPSPYHPSDFRWYHGSRFCTWNPADNFILVQEGGAVEAICGIHVGSNPIWRIRWIACWCHYRRIGRCTWDKRMEMAVYCRRCCYYWLGIYCRIHTPRLPGQLKASHSTREGDRYPQIDRRRCHRSIRRECKSVQGQIIPACIIGLAYLGIHLGLHGKIRAACFTFSILTVAGNCRVFNAFVLLPYPGERSWIHFNCPGTIYDGKSICISIEVSTNCTIGPNLCLCIRLHRHHRILL